MTMCFKGLCVIIWLCSWATTLALTDTVHFKEIGLAWMGTDHALLKVSTELMPSLPMAEKMLSEMKRLDILEEQAALGRAFLHSDKASCESIFREARTNLREYVQQGRWLVTELQPRQPVARPNSRSPRSLMDFLNV